MRSGKKLIYMYEMIIITGKNVINKLVCKIEGPLDQSQTFMMEVQFQWFNAPLENWLKTMTASRQKLAKVRYKLLISWVYYTQI